MNIQKQNKQINKKILRNLLFMQVQHCYKLYNHSPVKTLILVIYANKYNNKKNMEKNNQNMIPRSGGEVMGGG